MGQGAQSLIESADRFLISECDQIKQPSKREFNIAYKKQNQSEIILGNSSYKEFIKSCSKLPLTPTTDYFTNLLVEISDSEECILHKDIIKLDMRHRLDRNSFNNSCVNLQKTLSFLHNHE